MSMYESPRQRRMRAEAMLPTITSTVLVTLFFGLFGLIPAVRHSNAARAMGAPTGKYWKAFWITFGVGVVAWLIILVAAAAAGSSPSTGALGHHYGWQQPHNPHHASCAVVFHLGCASVDPPPTFFPVPPPVLYPM